MNRIIAILLIGVLLNACKTDGSSKEVLRDTYLITGEAPGIYNGIRAYLQETDERGRKINKDTAIIMNERFTFEGKVDTPKLWLLSINSTKGNLALIVENKEITIDVDKDDLANSEIKGTKANEELMAYNTNIKSYSTKITELNSKIRATDDKDLKSSLAVEYTKLTNEVKAQPEAFVKSHNNSLYSLVILDNMLNNKEADINNIASLYDNLDANLKSTKFGTAVNVKLQGIKATRERMSATEIGKTAPDFTAPTPDGKSLNLKSVLGKVTIVDFWAAWCGPCRRENPNVVKVYNKYHDKGLEIVGVSLDGNSRQKDPKAAWLQAIEKDKLTWHQVSNLNYFNDPVARAYNIRSIPATFILDENGTIIAKNLRGPALEAKIAELLD
ncbi:TlpA disulfide reductase family protein [Psychroserpens sp. SPM9]|uniref:TlpA disulfide reductase family protein n=1 Tax=Psychroserpens sp. SPM9 TaxID=2975598 RepID=UPI0021A96F47|nr:TlpA disulfide reductase family protein [Psychroserpens sp. SPM9]MDG5491281.1 TlpA disulfide reductase family protein [Psychroserpens sp. SPM9]